MLASMAAPLLSPDTVPALEATITDALQVRDHRGRQPHVAEEPGDRRAAPALRAPRLVRWALKTLQALFGDRLPAVGWICSRVVERNISASFVDRRENRCLLHFNLYPDHMTINQ
jgi:hypothetical protein